MADVTARVAFPLAEEDGLDPGPEELEIERRLLRKQDSY